MKLLSFIALFSILVCVAEASSITDPQTQYLSDYRAGDIVKEATFDLNGDGITDYFFAYIEANPDPVAQISSEQEGGSLSWDAYISIPNSNQFKTSDILELHETSGLLQGVAPLSVNPDEMYVGNISEIGRFAVVTSAVERSKAENSTIIYAYTWEGDRFKRWKLARYVAGQQNAIFDKYLKEDKRTHVAVQQIKP